MTAVKTQLKGTSTKGDTPKPLVRAPTASGGAAAVGSIPGTYVRLLFDYLARCEVDAEAILGEKGPLAGREPSYAAQHWRAMLEAASLHVNDAALGLRVGATITPAHLGPLGYVLLASSSVPAALERYIRYQRLVHDVSPVHCHVNESQLILEWNAESRSVGLLVNQCGMAAVVQFARDITGTFVAPEAVHFVEPEPSDAAPYEQMFRCPVIFGADATRLIFPLSLMSLPLRRTDPALVSMLEQQVQQRLAALPQRDDLAVDVRQRISRHLLQGELLLDRVAKEMHISGRTLRRKLEQAGWRFGALVEDTRRQMAEEYLRDIRLGLPEVALLLGYSEQSAFNRAFLRWTGMTPRNWRVAALSSQ